MLPKTGLRNKACQNKIREQRKRPDKFRSEKTEREMRKQGKNKTRVEKQQGLDMERQEWTADKT